MRHIAAPACLPCRTESQDNWRTPARGLMWGGLLSIPLWAIIGLVVARTF